VSGLLLVAQGIISSNGSAVTYASSKAVKEVRLLTFVQ